MKATRKTKKKKSTSAAVTVPPDAAGEKGAPPLSENSMTPTPTPTRAQLRRTSSSRQSVRRTASARDLGLKAPPLPVNTPARSATFTPADESMRREHQRELPRASSCRTSARGFEPEDPLAPGETRASLKHITSSHLHYANESAERNSHYANESAKRKHTKGMHLDESMRDLASEVIQTSF